MIDSPTKNKKKDSNPVAETTQDNAKSKSNELFFRQFPTREYFFATRGWGLTEEQAIAIYPKYSQGKSRSNLWK